MPEYNIDPWVSNKDSLNIESQFSVYKYALTVINNIGLVQQFDEPEILSATNNFSPDTKLGEGGFGVVHKGLLNGSFVAVKRLSLVSFVLCVVWLVGV